MRHLLPLRSIYVLNRIRKAKNLHSLPKNILKMSEKSTSIDKGPPSKDENNNELDKETEIEKNIETLLSALNDLSVNAEDDTENEDSMKKLKTLDLKGFVSYMKKCKKIVFLSGAGISTSAGIPDFRSPKTGLYDNLQKYNLPNPMMIFDLSFFKQNPNPFFTLCKELMPSDYKPTVAHYFQRLLAEKNMVLKCYTQNIDALESVANLPQEKVIYAHGSFKSGHCLSCRSEYSFEWMKKKIHEELFMRCENSDCLKDENKSEKLKIVKPDIVFFGETMPDVFIKSYRNDLDEADCVIVMGTSLAVQPFGSLIDFARQDCPRLLLNRDVVSDWALYENYPEKNTRDVSLIGDCDEGCWKLADMLGMKQELKDLIEKDLKRIEEQRNTDSI